MKILFRKRKLHKLANDYRVAERQLGKVRARKLRLRLDELDAAAALEDLRNLPQARCHELKGNRKRQLSVDLDHPYRLIFQPANRPLPTKEDGGLDWKRVTAVEIIEITDTHE